MLKKINLDESHSVEVNTSLGWLFAYKNAFGRDILPDLLPILEALVDALSGAFEYEEGGEVDPLAVLKNVDETTIANAFSTLSSLEVVTIINILWAMCKNADKSIPVVDEWVNQFDSFPLDEIVPELFTLIIDSSISTKNSKSLRGILTRIKKQTSTES